MRVTYRIPALVTNKKRSAGGTWRCIVPVTGAREIADAYDHEAPVAAILPISHAGSHVSLKFANGHFYRKAQGEAADAVESSLQVALGHAIFDHLIETRAYNKAIGPSPGKNAWLKLIYSMWKEARKSQRESAGTPPFPESLWMATKPFDPDRQDDDLLSKWIDVAERHLSSLLMIGGELWVPVAEPMMRERDGRYVYDDATCYRQRYAPPSLLPAPFGTTDTFGDSIDHLHPYWNPSWRYMSFPDAVEQGNGSEHWLGDVLLPDAFTVDHPTLQLDRAARLAAFMIGRIAERIDIEAWPSKSDWLSYQKTLKRQLRGRTDEAPMEGLEGALDEFSKFFQRMEGNSFIKGLPGSRDLRKTIDRAMASWSDRPINLGGDLSSDHRKVFTP